MNITLRICLALLISISSILLVVGYLGSFSTPDLIPRTLSLNKPSAEPSPTSAGLTINLPAIVAPVDDGRDSTTFKQTSPWRSIGLRPPRSSGERHDQIDRYIMEMLHTYPVQDLARARSISHREDLKRTVNKLLPRARARFATSISPTG